MNKPKARDNLNKSKHLKWFRQSLLKRSDEHALLHWINLIINGFGTNGSIEGHLNEQFQMR